MPPLARDRWNGQPGLWLAIAILLVSIAAGIALVISAACYPDDPVPASADRLLHAPAAAEPLRSS